MSSKIYFNPQYIRDRKTFQKLFSAYYSPLCLFANKYINNLETSKDLVQDVFVKLWERDIKISSWCTVKSFLYVTVRNACLNYLRNQEYENKNKKDYSELESDSLFEYHMLEEDVCYRLYEEVNKLSPRSRQVVLLTVQEYSNREIAEKMNVSINTVKTLKQRSYRKLKQNLVSILILILFVF